MVSTEFSVTGEFSEVERHTIDALYEIANVSQDAGDKFMAHLYPTMKNRLSADGKLAEKGVEFLKHVHKMYELMSSLLKFPDTAIYEDERTSVALKLMNYLEESGHVRKEMATRYVQYLVDLHISLGNDIEAGMTQLYQIKVLDWSDNALEAHGNMPAETERARKERLFVSAIGNFVRGEAHERAIALADQLCDYYKFDTYDYDSLARTLRDIALYYERVLHQQRFYYSYFRVVYYGQFDEEIREKEFIYRGCKLEAVIDFCNRMKKKFPGAKLHMSSEAPPPEMLQSSPQIISITTLTCEKDESEKRNSQVEKSRRKISMVDEKFHGVASRKPPPNVLKYKENNDLISFSYSKPIQKAKEKKPDNEFKHLWVLKTFVYAEESFPTNRRRVPVADRKEVLLSPVENAVRTILDKNEELHEKCNQVEISKDVSVDVGPLSMILNGMIDAAVNGGTWKYISAFLNDEFLQENAAEPNAARLQKELKDALKEQQELLKKGLAVFGRRADPSLKGLLDHLQSSYAFMVTKTKALLSQ